MKRNGILTARFEVFDDPKKAIEYAKSVNYPLVVKADGLAAGKGVIVCNDSFEVIDAIDKILVKKNFGNASPCFECQYRQHDGHCGCEGQIPCTGESNHQGIRSRQNKQGA